MDRGRTIRRSPARSGHVREYMLHTTEDWERRRSRSPACRSGNYLHRQESHRQLQDPLIDVVTAPAVEPSYFSAWELDPMVQESQGWVQRHLSCYSPDGGDKRVFSPVYKPDSALGTDPAASVQEHALPIQEDILFGPGVQLPDEHQLAEISERVTRMDIDTAPLSKELEAAGELAGDMEAGGHLTDVDDEFDVQVQQGATPTDSCAKFCSTMFRNAAALLLPRPTTPPRKGGRGRKRVMVATRSSTRLAGRPSPVPVAQRAQQKLMREMQFIDNPVLAPDAAITEFVDLFGQDLPADAVKAIRAATRMGNKQLSKVLAAMAAEAGAAEMEVP